VSYSWPIWHDVTACNYKGSKSWGSRDTGEVTVYVGTSATNSHELVQHVTTRVEQGDYTVYRFGWREFQPDGSWSDLRLLATRYMHRATRRMLPIGVSWGCLGCDNEHESRRGARECCGILGNEPVEIMPQEVTA
jgi:hypothetical protein